MDEVQELKRQEEEEGFVGKPRRPRVLVLSPTRELTDQIAGVARQLSHHAKLRTVALSTGIKCAPPSLSSLHATWHGITIPAVWLPCSWC